MSLRIFAGKHRGRKLYMNEGKEIRPTSGRAREAVFNILVHGEFAPGGDTPLAQQTIADLFCGCGALGCEALSRGARFVTFVDQSNDAAKLVKANLEHLGEDKNARIIRSDSANLPYAPRKHRLVFMDPPYKSGLAPKALASLDKQGWLEGGALVVVEVSSKEDLEPPPGFEVTDKRDYGNSRMYFVRYRA